MRSKFRLILELISCGLVLFAAAMIFGVLLTGCGHNVVSNSRGTGVEITWDGGSYIPSFRLGQWDTTNVVVKENVEIETQTNTTTGASSQMASTSSSNKKISSQPSGQAQAEAKGGIVLKMKTGPQSNGYVKDILTSPNLTDQSASLAEQIYGVKKKSNDTKDKE